MEPVRSKIKNSCWMKKVLMFCLLLLCACPSICGASGIKDKDAAFGNPDKKFINHYFNATEFHRKGEFDKALDEYKKAMEYTPSNMMILNCMGRVYRKMGQFDEAAAIFRQILKKIDSRQAEAKARSSLGVIYMDQSKYEKALEEMERCLDLEPEPAGQMGYKSIINRCRAEME